MENKCVAPSPLLAPGTVLAHPGGAVWGKDAFRGTFLAHEGLPHMFTEGL